MKKQNASGKKLLLNKDSIRNLQSEQLDGIAGGTTGTCPPTVVSNCGCTASKNQGRNYVTFGC